MRTRYTLINMVVNVGGQLMNQVLLFIHIDDHIDKGIPCLLYTSILPGKGPGRMLMLEEHLPAG